jgi:hypothetical protein
VRGRGRETRGEKVEIKGKSKEREKERGRESERGRERKREGERVKEGESENMLVEHFWHAG